MLHQSPSIPLVQKMLLAWYKKNGRTLPWRATSADHSPLVRDPYLIVVSELMLQQTQVARVLPKFEEFIRTWPTIQSLSHARLSDVLIQWKGLGYNRRAKFLLETAKIITHQYGGVFPSDTKKLKALPGFGDYMVSAIRVFALGEQDPVVDVNVARVLHRIFVGLEMVSAKEIRKLATLCIPKGSSDTWHQTLMDFGATICTATPHCNRCPVSRLCIANRQAKKKGFPSYAEWLMKQPKIPKTSKKDTGKKFEQTDRYFRGRIIDFLREKERSMEEVQTYILVEKKLEDRLRFGKIIEQLVIDGLLQVKGNRVRLP